MKELQLQRNATAACVCMLLFVTIVAAQRTTLEHCWVVYVFHAPEGCMRRARNFLKGSVILLRAVQSSQPEPCAAAPEAALWR
jgi:hypothetical protein